MAPWMRCPTWASPVPWLIRRPALARSRGLCILDPHSQPPGLKDWPLNPVRRQPTHRWQSETPGLNRTRIIQLRHHGNKWVHEADLSVSLSLSVWLEMRWRKGRWCLPQGKDWLSCLPVQLNHVETVKFPTFSNSSSWDVRYTILKHYSINGWAYEAAMT